MYFLYLREKISFNGRHTQKLATDMLMMTKPLKEIRDLLKEFNQKITINKRSGEVGYVRTSLTVS